MYKLKFILLVSLFSSQVLAIGKAENAIVSDVRIDRSGNGIVAFNKAISGTPASCRNAEGYANHFSFNTNTEGGRAIYAMVLSAAATRSPITAYGTGTCNEFSNYVESWEYGHLFAE